METRRVALKLDENLSHQLKGELSLLGLLLHLSFKVT